MDEKTCTKCLLSKPVEEFCKNRSKPDGRNIYCKTCTSKKQADWVQANPDKRKAIRKASRTRRLKESPELRAKRLAYQRQWKEDHPGQVKEHGRRDRAKKDKNPERLANDKVAKRQWFIDNPGYARTACAKRRAQKKAAPVVEAIDIAILYARDKGICGLCNLPVKRQDASHDHIIPLSKGGEHSYRNACLTHKRCNFRKGNRTVVQQMRLF